jgi:hypothetical protein
LASGDPRTALEAVTSAAGYCAALRTQGARLGKSELAELNRLHASGLAAAAALRKRIEAAQQTLSASRRATAAYVSPAR